MIEHSRYELREDDDDDVDGVSAKDLEQMIDKCVLEKDDEVADDEKRQFQEAMSPPQTLKKSSSEESWVEQTLSFFMCGSPRGEGGDVARPGRGFDACAPVPPPPGSPPPRRSRAEPESPQSARIEARWASEQIELLRQLRTEDGPGVAVVSASLAAGDGRPWLVGGLDMSFFPDDERSGVASLVVCEVPSLRRVHAIHETIKLEGPYIAGFLAFREAPHYCRLLDRLRRDRPDCVPALVFVDGNGVLHPRGFGCACHVGVAANIPTVGVAKSLLNVDGLDERAVRDACAEANLWFGGSKPLVGDSGRTWGAALRSSRPPKQQQQQQQQEPQAADAPFRPIFVSIGHDVCLATALRITTACCQHRVPEPIRLADLEGRDVIRTMMAGV